MAVVFALVILFSFWAIVYLSNEFLISYSPTSLAYAKLLHQSGLSLSIFQIKWFTIKLNRIFIKLANWKPKFWHIWFNAGVFVGLIGQISSIFLLIYTLFDFFRKKKTEKQLLVPVVSYN
jgi:S2P endopeptidase